MRYITRLLLAALSAALLGACNFSAPAITSTALPTFTPAPSVTPLPSATPAPDAIATAGSPDSAPVEASSPQPGLPAPTATPTCIIRAEWPLYTVASGDTLGAIARRVGSTAGDLAAANCLDNPDRLTVGQTLHVPALPGDVPALPGDVPALPGDAQPGDAPTLAATTAELVRFEAAPAEVDRGQAFTLRWEVRGADYVTVSMIAGGEPRLRTLAGENLPPTGELTTTIPAERHYLHSAAFDIAAYRADNTFLPFVAYTNVVVQVRCPYEYFFTPPSDTCPLDPPAQTEAAVQQFENGYMLWRADTREIYVMTYAPAQAVSIYPDTWTPGEAVAFAEAPPPGLIQPDLGFGKVWVQNAPVRDALGWATGPEQPYTMQFQLYLYPRYPQFDRLYFTWPDGRLAYITGPTWQFA